MTVEETYTAIHVLAAICFICMMITCIVAMYNKTWLDMQKETLNTMKFIRNIHGTVPEFTMDELVTTSEFEHDLQAYLKYPPSEGTKKQCDERLLKRWLEVKNIFTIRLPKKR